MTVLSPLTQRPAKTIKKISISDIISNYHNALNINVQKYFEKINFIEIYECRQTGYRFYYPFNVSGGSKFYEELQVFHWYYMHWKWEHQKAIEFIRYGASVLEVGCAQGDFLQEIKKSKNAEVTGLELNESVKNTEIRILNETIQNYSFSNQERHDVVCSFQVLEHITDVKSFLEAQIQTLKKGGYLIISVPNNKSFIKYADNALNLPPHHMGLWNSKSLKRLARMLNLRVKGVYFEPLQSYHYKWYLEILEKRMLSIGLPRRLIHFHFIRLFRRLLPNISKFIHGHTVVVCLSKR